MELTEIQNEWCEFEALVAWQSLTGDQVIYPGAHCYARLNRHDPNHFEVIFKNKESEFINGVYIHQRYAVNLINPLRVMKEQRRITGLWDSYWSMMYKKK